MNDQQALDNEDHALFRKRLRELRAAAETAALAEEEQRNHLRACEQARREAQARLDSFLEADCRPLPLFDTPPADEPAAPSPRRSMHVEGDTITLGRIEGDSLPIRALGPDCKTRVEVVPHQWLVVTWDEPAGIQEAHGEKGFGNWSDPEIKDPWPCRQTIAAAISDALGWPVRVEGDVCVTPRGRVEIALVRDRPTIVPPTLVESPPTEKKPSKRRGKSAGAQQDAKAKRELNEAEKLETVLPPVPATRLRPVCWLPDGLQAKLSMGQEIPWPSHAGCQTWQLCLEQLASYPDWWGVADDLTAQQERRIVKDRLSGRPEDEDDAVRRQLILAWRAALRMDADHRPAWGEWGEIHVAFGSAAPLHALYFGRASVGGTDQFVIHKPGISSVGQMTLWADRHDLRPQPDESVADYACRVALHECAKQAKVEQRRSARQPKPKTAKEGGL